MDIVTKIRARAKAKPKTIALPEIEDMRVKEAARIVEKEGIARVLLFGRGMLDKAKQEEYAQMYYELRKSKGMSLDDARKALEDPLYYAAMMTHNGDSDGFVAGASHTTPDVARAAIHCLGVDERINIASSCFLMSVPECSYGEEGAFIFGDCGIVPDPNPRQLACIAISNAELAKRILGITPKVALLSYSTKGSGGTGESIIKVQEATRLVSQREPSLLIDGEVQVDCAVVPEVAKRKDPNGRIKGRANIFIFPNLDAGNISYKLTQRLAKARAIGPLLQGLKKPASDLSRGCDAQDIIDAVAITAVRASY